MPDDGPSLGEILSVRPEGDLSLGSNGGTDAIIPFNKAIDYLDEAAKQKAESDKYKVEQFQANQKDFFKDFDSVNVDGVMESDYPEINKEYANLAHDIHNNLDIIRNPLKDETKYADLKTREAQLRGKISQSKMDKAYRDNNMLFLRANPDFLTNDNKGNVEQFTNQTLGNRQYHTLNVPFVYNPKDYADVANKVAQQKLSSQQQKGLYLLETESTKYLQDEYLKAWDALHSMQDKSGRTGWAAAEDAYNKMPPELKNGMDFKPFNKQIGLALKMQDDAKDTQKPDEAAMLKYRMANENNENEKNRRLQRWLKMYDKPKEQEAGGLYNVLLTSAFTGNGSIDPHYLQNIYGNNDKVKIKTGSSMIDMNDKSPTFGQTITAGKEEDVPKIQVTKSQLSPDGKLVYYFVDNSLPDNDPNRGKEQASQPVDYDKARGDFFNIIGPANALKVAKEQQEYRNKYKLRFNPDVEELRKHFNFDNLNKSPTVVKGL